MKAFEAELRRQIERPPQPIARRILSEIESDPAYRRRRIGKETAAPRPEEPNG